MGPHGAQDAEADIVATRRRFIARQDAADAARFCPTCTTYIGAAGPCRTCAP